MKGGEVVQGIETGIMIVIETGNGNGIDIMTEIKIVKGLGMGVLEVVETEEEGWIGGPGMVEKEPGIGTVIGVDHAHLLGMVTEGHLEVQFARISQLS